MAPVDCRLMAEGVVAPAAAGPETSAALLALFHLPSNSSFAWCVLHDISDSVVGWLAMSLAAKVYRLGPCSSSPSMTSHGGLNFQKDILHMTASAPRKDRKTVPLANGLSGNCHKTSLDWLASPSLSLSDKGNVRPSSDVSSAS